MPRRLRATIALGLAAAVPAGGAAACSAETDCVLESGRAYRIDLPDGAPRGAVFFAHGYRGSAAGTMRNGGLRDIATSRGLAFVALGAADEDWDLPNAPRAEDEDGAEEFAYVLETIADIAARFDVPADRLTMAGFSAGGVFVWNMACAYPQAFEGYVSVSGTYWQGPPERCAEPGELLHIHGRTDATVPLEGRPIADTCQGRVAEALAHYRALGGFGRRRISRSSTGWNATSLSTKAARVSRSASMTADIRSATSTSRRRWTGCRPRATEAARERDDERLEAVLEEIVRAGLDDLATRWAIRPT